MLSNELVTEQTNVPDHQGSFNQDNTTLLWLNNWCAQSYIFD